MAGPRYHPSVPCGSQDLRCAGFSWIKILVPGGAMGVRLKSKGPSNMVWADIFGFRRAGRNMLSVVVACGMSRSQRWVGKVGSVLQSPAIKWFFHVRMARSAALRRCMCGGTSWKSTSLVRLNAFKALDASLSNQWICGRKPLLVRCWWRRV